jgi:uncharacterized SAM-binding protein YcdF (DUF218 family)
MPAVGTALTDCQAPERSDAALVLAGDGYGNRILAGADLARQGLVPKVLVSGPLGFYGFHEDELAIRYAVDRGYSPQFFVGVPMEAHSTREEARKWVPIFRRMGIKSLDLVTSDFHTRRAGRAFRDAAPDIRIRTVCVGYALFETAQWWKQREGRKMILLEWTKTVTDWMGM